MKVHVVNQHEQLIALHASTGSLTAK